MKILIFSDRDIKHPFSGGSMINIHEQAKRWVAWGHEVTMITMRPRGHSFRDTIDGLRIFRAGSRYTVYLCAPILYLAYLRKRADVVLDIINGIPFATPLFSRKPKVGLMHQVHRQMFLIELGPLIGRLGRAIEHYVVPLLYRKVPIITVSRSSNAQIRELLHHGDRLDIRLVYNGIDHEFYKSTGQKFEKPTILSLGRVKKYKQIPRLIRMMPEVRKQVPQVELIIAGGGDAVDECEEAIELLRVGDFVRYIGFVSEEKKLQLYQRVWTVASTSMVEGWGLTVVEANACGTPAVAFNVTGLNESIKDGKTGILAQNEEEFIGHLVNILTDENLREKLTQGALAWAGTFSWDSTARQTLSALEEAVNGSPNGGGRRP